MPQQIGTWDVAYFTHAAKQIVLRGNAGDVPKLAHYFPLGAVMQGVSSLLEKLFAVTLHACTPHHGELWADDVTKIAGGT